MKKASKNKTKKPVPNPEKYDQLFDEMFFVSGDGKVSKCAVALKSIKIKEGREDEGNQESAPVLTPEGLSETANLHQLFFDRPTEKQIAQVRILCDKDAADFWDREVKRLTNDKKELAAAIIKCQKMKKEREKRIRELSKKLKK